MVQLHKTFGFTTLALLFLFMVGYTTTAFSQGEKIVKKKMIIKTIDENGVEQTKIIETDGELEDMMLQGQPNHFFFKSDGQMPPSMMHQKKVVMLEEDDEQIPAHLLTEIQEMGVDLASFQAQFAAAEKSIRIYQENGQVQIEVDGDLDIGLPQMQGEQFPKMHKRMLLLDEDGDMQELEQEIDVNVDMEDINGMQEGTIKININGDVQELNFSGAEMPEDVKAKLDALGIDLDIIGGQNEEIEIDGKKRIMIIETDGENLSDGQHKMIWMDDKDGAIDIDKNTFHFESDDNVKKQIIIKKDCEGQKNAKCDKANKACDKNKGACCAKSSCKPAHKARLGIFLEEGVEGKVLVQDVIENSAAKEGGLLEGDVIYAINKTAIKSNQALIEAIGQYQPGDQVTVKFKRDGKKQKAKVMLKAAPVRKKRHHIRHADMHGMLPQINRQVDCEKACNTPMLGVMIRDAEAKGVRVASVFEQSGAEKAGLFRDDVITKIGNTAVTTTQELINQIKGQKPGDQVAVTYLRADKEATANVVLSSQTLASFNPECDCNRPDFIKEQPTESKEIIIIKPNVTELPKTEAPTVEKKVIKRATLEVSEFSLFPNPNKGTFTASFQLDNKTPITVTVVDVTGKEVYRQAVQDFNGNYRQQIDVSQYAKGIYFLNVVQGELRFTKQFVYN